MCCRFYEAGGVPVLLGAMEQFRGSVKYQRQACWAVLTLAASDDISRQMVTMGVGTHLLTAMLEHRYELLHSPANATIPHIIYVCL